MRVRSKMGVEGDAFLWGSYGTVENMQSTQDQEQMKMMTSLPGAPELDKALAKAAC